MKESTPALDIQNQLFNNTCIFKENLKVIAAMLIESVWREKVKAEKIKETIKAAFNDIYRGEFEEIKELDEEQLYSSLLNSGNNTERMKSDPFLIKGAPQKNEFVIELKAKHKTEEARPRVHDLKPQRDFNVPSRKSNERRKKSTKSTEKEQPARETMFETMECPQTPQVANNSGKYSKDKSPQVKVIDIRDAYEEECMVSEEHISDEVAHSTDHAEEKVLLSASKSSNQQHAVLPSSVLKNRNRKHMRSFDRVAPAKSKPVTKTSSFKNERQRHKKVSNGTYIRDFKSSVTFFKDQHITNANNTVRKDARAGGSKVSSTDAKFKKNVSTSIHESHFKMKLSKMHARNRSTNSLNGRSSDENFYSKLDQFKTINRRRGKGEEYEVMSGEY